VSTAAKEGSDEHELKMSKETENHDIKLGIWANLKGKAGRYELFLVTYSVRFDILERNCAFGCRMKVIYFHDLLLSADVPKQIANMDVALRLLFTVSICFFKFSW
jgi:hypothetical protein